jgi:hypothetical protein
MITPSATNFNQAVQAEKSNYAARFIGDNSLQNGQFVNPNLGTMAGDV